MTELRAIQREIAGALKSAAMPRVASLSGDDKADDADRLAVYHRGYRIRLREALSIEFQGLALLAGRQFRALLDDYVAARPSTHFNIRWHGQGLADFLASAAVWRDRAAWVEMAQLDWAISTAFDAAGSTAMGVAELAELPPDAWGCMRLHPQLHAGLLRISRNVDTFRRAADQGRPRPTVRRLRQPRHVLVWRPALEVRYRVVPPGELLALQSLLDGDTFAGLCERLAASEGHVSAMPHLVALLMQWVGEGLIVRVSMP